MPLLTIKEAARELGIGSTYCWQLTARGQLPVVRLGRLVRIRPEDLARFAAEHVDGATTCSTEAPALPPARSGRRTR